MSWQEIPSLVEATDDDGTHKIPPSQRFQALIDHLAMKQGLAGMDSYLEEWTRGEIQECDGTVEEVATAEFEELEAQFDDLLATATVNI